MLERVPRWSVYLSVPVEEVEALRAVAPPEASFADVDGFGGAELVLPSDQEDREWASRDACEAYAALRRTAGLGEGTTRVVALVPDAAREGVLMDEARALHEAGHHGWAVVAAQTACELRGRAAIAALAVRHGALGELAERFANGANPANDRVRRTLAALTAKDPAQEPWWPEYLAHAQRRNRVAHEGAVVSREDAAASLRACTALLAYLEAAG